MQKHRFYIVLLGVFFNSYSNSQQPSKLDDIISSKEYEEFAPSVNATGKTLIFESNRISENTWRLYESSLDSAGKWCAPVPLNKINNFGQVNDLIGGPSISYDGNTLFFFASFDGGKGQEDIYYSEREGDGWSTPKNIGAPINTSGYEGFPSISSDGKRLYFVRDAEKSSIKNEQNKYEYCFKIYYSEKGDDGKWGNPLPLPYPINIECEKSPRIMSDNKTLIFASYRKGGKGGFDIYLTKLSDDGEWSYPVNLAFLNTAESDQFVSASASGDVMYYYSKGDIYTIPVPEEFKQSKNITIQGFIIDAFTKKPISNAVIKVCDATTTKEIINLSNNPSDGRYTVVLTEGKKYNMQVFAPNYSSNSVFYDLVSIKKYEEINRTIELSSNVGLLLNVYDKERFNPIDASLTFSNATTSEKLTQYNTTAFDGRSFIKLPIGINYRIYANADKYKEKHFDFDLTSIVKFNEFERNIELELKEPNKNLTTLKGFIIDANTNKPIDATFEIIDNEKNEVVATFKNDPNTGEYIIELPAGKNYGIVVKSDSYLFHSENLNIDFSNRNEKNEIKLDIPMKKAEIGAKIVLNNIFFDFGKTTLRSESVAELNNVIKLFNDMPTINVEISGHTDNIGSKETNLRISNDRAKTVVDFLIANGIEKNRLTYKGYGFDQPTDSNDTEEGRQKNRRTEFKIMSK